jgi:plastocyanin
MFKLSILFCVALVALRVAHAATINVDVGGPGVLKFTPPFVNASAGDIVRFTFHQKNHTATQSTLQSPCAPKVGGFDSGFIPVADSVTSGFPVAQLTVTDTNPVWVYCRQANHCQQGMVFAVNPGNDFAAFQAAATGGASATSTLSATGGVATATATLTVGGQSVTTTTSAGAPTSTGSVDHKVVVGGTGVLAYNPSNITAQVGDTVTFEFHQVNHTVTQSSFNTPCRALSLTSTTGAVGFDSGFNPVTSDATTFPTYTITVNATTPIWAYCRQAKHCGQGMVFSINSVETGPNNFAAFQALAKQQNGTSSSTTSTASGANRRTGTFRSASVAAFVFALFGAMI